MSCGSKFFLSETEDSALSHDNEEGEKNRKDERKKVFCPVDDINHRIRCSDNFSFQQGALRDKSKIIKY